MQKPAQNPPENPERRIDCLLEEGDCGATTREIARLAKVNEVTLFRHFKTKKQLLEEVMASCSDTYDLLLAEAPVETAEDVKQTVSKYVNLSNTFFAGK